MNTNRVTTSGGPGRGDNVAKGLRWDENGSFENGQGWRGWKEDGRGLAGNERWPGWALRADWRIQSLLQAWEPLKGS